LKRISFDPIAQVFDRTRGPPDHVMQQLIGSLESELVGCRTILDAGVGTGRFAKPLQDEEFEVVGIDISQKMLSVAKDKGVTNLFRGDVCFLPFRDNLFDATICNAVLHLIPEWKTALKEICRVTRKIMVSTIHERDNPMREAYARLLRSHGYEKPRRGKPEYDLKDLVVPLKSLHAVSYYVDIEESLDHMCQRAFSYQWNVPENVNNQIINELRRRFPRKRARQGLSILVWNVEDLRAYVQQRQRE